MLLKFLILFGPQSLDVHVAAMEHVVDFSSMENADLRNLEVDRILIILGSQVQKDEDESVLDSNPEISV